jgi:predicted phage terminase large subunit-like protein
MINKQALEKMLSGTPQERKFLAEQSFGLFAIYYFKDYFKYALADYHYDFIKDCEDLAGNNIREVAWIGFRECAKTTFAKIFVIWLVATNKRRYINVDSFDKENAERILFDVAYEMTNNKRLQADFGVLFSKERSINDIKQNRINNFVCQNGVRVEAHSTQESVRGRLHLNQRPDCLILDDIETNKTKESQAYTKQVAGHISEAMAGMSPDGFILYLGNYITEYGNIANLFKRAEIDPKIRVRNIPIIIDGKPAWEGKYELTDALAEQSGKVSIEDKQRQLGSLVFSYEMMNQPIDDSVAEFKREHIQIFEEDKLIHLNTNTYITVDTAISEKTSADFTGITINRVSQDNKWYITAYKIKVNPKNLIDHLFYLQETYRPALFGIEKTTFTMGVKPFLEDEMRNRNKFLNIRELSHTTQSKETRIRALIPRWESKSIFLVGNCNDLLEEMRTFPRGNHDDVIDSLSMMEEIAEKPIDMSEWDRILGNNDNLYNDIGI